MKNEEISGLIRTTLEKKGLTYKYTEKPSPVFNLSYKSGDTRLNMSVYPLYDDRIFIRMVFPCRPIKEMYAAAAMLVTEYNRDRAFATLHLRQDGLITMEYTFHVLTSLETDRKILEMRINGLSKEAFRIYGKIRQLCDGPYAMSDEDRHMYIERISDNLTAFYVCSDDEDDDDDEDDEDDKLPLKGEKKGPRVFPYSNSAAQNKCS